MISQALGGDRYRVVAGTDIVPELRWYQNVHWVRSRGHRLGGWYLQMLIKLAIAPRIESEFYLTLDADVFCVRPVRFDRFITDGRAVFTRRLASDPAPDLTVEMRDKRRDWAAGSARVLRVPQSQWVHEGAPQLLSREAVQALARHLEGLLPMYMRAIPTLSSWRLLLLLQAPRWTEYEIYGAFLEGQNLYDRYHVDGDLRGNCALWREEIAEWDPKESFSGPDTFPFSVVQSNTDVRVIDIWERVRDYILASGEPVVADVPIFEHQEQRDHPAHV